MRSHCREGPSRRTDPSRSPRRRRTTAMNHKNATIPNGARFSPTKTVKRLSELAYHPRSALEDPTPGWRASRYTDSDRSTAAPIPESAAASTDDSARRAPSIVACLTCASAAAARAFAAASQSGARSSRVASQRRAVESTPRHHLTNPTACASDPVPRHTSWVQDARSDVPPPSVAPPDRVRRFGG
jgi:hypothetical protein